MKQTIVFVLAIACLSSCGTGRQVGGSTPVNIPESDTLITQSLFNDKAATISEENIQNTAVLLTIEEIGEKINEFLNMK